MLRSQVPEKQRLKSICTVRCATWSDPCRSGLRGGFPLCFPQAFPHCLWIGSAGLASVPGDARCLARGRARGRAYPKTRGRFPLGPGRSAKAFRKLEEDGRGDVRFSLWKSPGRDRQNTHRQVSIVGKRLKTRELSEWNRMFGHFTLWSRKNGLQALTGFFPQAFPQSTRRVEAVEQLQWRTLSAPRPRFSSTRRCAALRLR